MRMLTYLRKGESKAFLLPHACGAGQTSSSQECPVLRMRAERQTAKRRGFRMTCSKADTR